MESGLIKMYHENEHFDIYHDMWDSGRETLHMNLTHSLEGILPASPNHQSQLINDFECELDNKNFVSANDKLLHHQIKLEYDTEEEDEFERRKISMTSIESDDLLRCITPAVEIIPIDPDCEYNSPYSPDRIDEDDSSFISSSDDNDDDEEEDENEDNLNEVAETIEYNHKYNEVNSLSDDIKSNTDNNISINEDGNEICDIRLDLSDFISPIKQYNLLQTSNEKESPLKLSFNKSGEDDLDDKLDNDIDLKNFDLTKYITEDDCKLPPPTPERKIKIEKSTPTTTENKFIPKRGYKKLSKEFIESDSDESVDVETISEPIFVNKTPKIEYNVEIEMNSINQITSTPKKREDLIKDPTWTPNHTSSSSSSSLKIVNSTTTTNATISNNNNNNNNITKSRSVSLRQRVRAILPNPPNTNKNKITNVSQGISILKTKQILNNMVITDNGQSQSSDHDYCSKIKKQTKLIDPPRKTIEIQPINPAQNRKKLKIGLGRGKNLSTLLNNDKELIKLTKELDNSEKITVQNDNIQKKEEKLSTIITPPEPVVIASPVKEKRKLNLQEYKKRREIFGDKKIISNFDKENNTAENSKKNECDQLKINSNLLNSDKISMQESVLNGFTKENNFTDKTEQILRIAEEKSENKLHDPILEATKKALRLKKNKMNEPEIVIPTNSLIPLLPLAELTAMNSNFKGIMENKSSGGLDDLNKNALTNLNEDYEEIIIVSMGSNTNITLPPSFDMNITNNMNGKASLLSNISDTINKVKSAGENVKITSNSLLSSITNVVLKKSNDKNSKTGIPSSHVSPNIGKSPPNPYSPGKPETASVNIQNEQILTNNMDIENVHGEDKVIMHLRKDRIRPKKNSISIQTDALPHFSPLRKLEKSRIRSNSKSRHRSYRKRNSSASSTDDHYRNRHSKSRSRHRSPSPLVGRRHDSYSRHSIENRTSSNRHRNYNRSYSPRRYRSRSPRLRSRRNSRSVSRERNNVRYTRPESRNSIKSSSSTSSEYSRYRNKNRKRSYRSRSSSRSSSSSSRSRSRCSSRNNRSRSSSSRSKNRSRRSSPEERRIVYVGRIEKETTKDDIRNKFIIYGPIRQITFHHKDTGMKYGFVTYEKAQDAFKAIDSGVRDPNISMYDISFGGRRAFCRNFYSDLDGAISNQCSTLVTSNSLNTLEKEDSFEALLQKVKEKISAKKPVKT